MRTIGKRERTLKIVRKPSPGERLVPVADSAGPARGLHQLPRVAGCRPGEREQCDQKRQDLEGRASDLHKGRETAGRGYEAQTQNKINLEAHWSASAGAPERRDAPPAMKVISRRHSLGEDSVWINGIRG